MCELYENRKSWKYDGTLDNIECKDKALDPNDLENWFNIVEEVIDLTK